MAYPRSLHLGGTGISNVASGDRFRPYYRDADADLREPAEIVAELHAQIAAKSPQHAALVARFERKQAAKARRS